jgi:hypothetical protein
MSITVTFNDDDVFTSMFSCPAEWGSWPCADYSTCTECLVAHLKAQDTIEVEANK